MDANQPLGDFAGRSLTALSDALRTVRPSMVLVQGDTTTALTAALAACYQRIPVGHVEAGLRSFDIGNPFPEEINRALVGFRRRPSLRPDRVGETESAARVGAGEPDSGHREHRRGRLAVHAGSS